MCKIMQVQMLSNLWSAGFGLTLNSPNVRKLEYLRSIEITRVQVCFRNTFASTAEHFKKFMSLPFMADVVIFYFSIQFQKWKRFVHFIWLILLLTCKNLCGYWILMVAISGKKKIHCKDCSSKLYFSKGIQSNLPRSKPEMLLEKTEQ